MSPNNENMLKIKLSKFKVGDYIQIKMRGLKEKRIGKIVKSKFTFALLYPLSFICNRLRIGDVVEVCLEK